MKKWIAIITCTACTLSSPVCADDLSHDAANADVQTPDPTMAVIESQPDASNTDETPPEERKEVGLAATDGSTTGVSNAGKYILAGSAIAVAVVALILVSRHSGHRK